MTAREKNPCEAAHAVVVSQCAAECSNCTVKASGCDAEVAAFHFREKFEELGQGPEAKFAVLGMRRRGQVPAAMAGVTLLLASALLSIGLRSWTAARTNPRGHYRNLLNQDDFAEEGTAI